MTRVLARTLQTSSNDERSLLFVVATIEAAEVFKWCSAAGFSIYAEDGLKRYCLWKVICVAQHRGNLYRDSRLAKQLETIGPRLIAARMPERRGLRRRGENSCRRMHA
jgi:AmiR/NasT family two-component response regulator